MVSRPSALPALDDRDARRIISSSALMTSSNDGEALAAVRATCRLLEPHGVGPADVFRAALANPHVQSPPRHQPSSTGSWSTGGSGAYGGHRYTARMCLFFGEAVLNDWERQFLISITGETRLTPKQAAKLESIRAKVDAVVSAANSSPKREGGNVEF